MKKPIPHVDAFLVILDCLLEFYRRSRSLRLLKKEAAAVADAIVDEGLLQCKVRPAEKVSDPGSTNGGVNAGL
jgi:hypothetical protein